MSDVKTDSVEVKDVDPREDGVEAPVSKPTPKSPEALETLGTVLLRARRVKKVTLKHVSSVLHISEEYLDALEKDDLEALPGKAYVIGFVRAYASYLGIDSAPLVEKIEEREMEETRLVMPEPIEGNGKPSKILMFATLALAAMGVFFWVLSDRADREELLDAVAAPEVPAGEEVVVENVVAEDVVVEEQQPAAPVVANQTVRLVANDRVWIQVRQPESDNNVLYDKVMSEGMEYSLNTADKAVVDIGKPEALDIYVDGVHVGHIGSTGVIRGFALSAENLEGTQFVKAE